MAHPRMDRQQAIKSISGNFLFEVTGPEGKVQHFRVDMRKEGRLIKGKGDARPKPDVTIRVADKDMVDLASGKANPQSMFLKGGCARVGQWPDEKLCKADLLLTTRRETQGQRQHHAGPEDEQHPAKGDWQAEQVVMWEGFSFVPLLRLCLLAARREHASTMSLTRSHRFDFCRLT